MPAVTVLNLKGGVGKTVVLVGTGKAISEMDNTKPVLFIDADTQGGLTRWTTAGDPKRFKHNLGTAIAGHEDIRDTILELGDTEIDSYPSRRKFWEGLHLIPCSRGRITVDSVFGVGSDYALLRRLLTESGLLAEFNILIDTGHGDNDSTMLGFVAGDQSVSVVNAGSYHSLAQLEAVTTMVSLAREVPGHEHVGLAGAVITNYDQRYGTQQAIVKKVSAAYGEKLFAVIERRADVERAIMQHKPLQAMTSGDMGKIPTQLADLGAVLVTKVLGARA